MKENPISMIMDRRTIIRHEETHTSCPQQCKERQREWPRERERETKRQTDLDTEKYDHSLIQYTRKMNKNETQTQIKLHEVEKYRTHH
jgi:hypothetical protein